MVSIVRRALRQTGTYGAAKSGTSKAARHCPPAGRTRWPVAGTGPIRQVQRKSVQVVTTNGTQNPARVLTRPVAPAEMRRSGHSTSLMEGPQSGQRAVSTNKSHTVSGAASITRETTSRYPSGVFSRASASVTRPEKRARPLYPSKPRAEISTPALRRSADQASGHGLEGTH